MDSSSKRTRRAILDAFNELIRKIEFDKISVTQICKQADVSKATFYRYYKDKYDVMNENYRIILHNCASAEGVTGYRDLYYNLYSTAQSGFWISIRRSFNSDGYNSFRHFIATYSYDFAEEITRQNRNGEGYTEVEKLQCRVYTSGIGQMYEEWTFNKYHLTPDEAADALFEIMPPSLRDYWWKKPISQDDMTS